MRLKALFRGGPMGELYREAGLEKVIARSLNFILIGNICGGMWGTVCSGSTTAMVALATELGAGDLGFSLLTAIPSIAAILQIPFSALVNRNHKRKKYMLTYGLVSRFLWLLFGLLPVVAPGHTGLYLMLGMLSVSSCLSSMINVCWFPWFSDLAPIQIRTRWLGTKETLCALFNFALGLLTAWLLDNLPTPARFITVFGIAGLLGLTDMCSFGFAKEVYSASATHAPLTRVVKDALRNRRFMRFTLMWTVWAFTWNMDAVYFTPYSMNEMGLSSMQVTLFGSMVASAVTALMMPRWGRALTRYTERSVMLLCCLVASFMHLSFLLATPGSVVPLLMYNVVGAFFWSGANLGASSMQLSTTPDDTRPTYLALFAVFTSLAGTTLGSLLGGTLLEWWHSAGFFAGSFDRYKALILLSTILRTAGVCLLVPAMGEDPNNPKPSLFSKLKPRG